MVENHAELSESQENCARPERRGHRDLEKVYRYPRSGGELRSPHAVKKAFSSRRPPMLARHRREAELTATNKPKQDDNQASKNDMARSNAQNIRDLRGNFRRHPNAHWHDHSYSRSFIWDLLCRYRLFLISKVLRSASRDNHS
jgi:hypothetical protein